MNRKYITLLAIVTVMQAIILGLMVYVPMCFEQSTHHCDSLQDHTTMAVVALAAATICTVAWFVFKSSRNSDK